MLIKIDAIINEEKFDEVMDALNAVHVNGITVSQVMGCGTQHGFTSRVRGSDVDITLLPKIKMEIVVSSEKWEEKVIQTIRDAAYTGSIGDGKIFSYEIRTATKIRTNETGKHAIWGDVQRKKHEGEPEE